MIDKIFQKIKNDDNPKKNANPTLNQTFLKNNCSPNITKINSKPSNIKTIAIPKMTKILPTTKSNNIVYYLFILVTIYELPPYP